MEVARHTSVTTLAVCFPLTRLHILYQFTAAGISPPSISTMLNVFLLDKTPIKQDRY
jgi:hypothetical protein